MTQRIFRYRVEAATAAIAFVLGSNAGLTSGCSSRASAAPAAEATPVDAATVAAERRAVPRAVTVTGTLVANREAAIAADVGGKVIATFVERGDLVEAGAPLARLDARAAALSRAEAAASAAALLAQERNAKLECERAERLFAANVISRAERDRVLTSCETSLHSSQAARARAGLADKVVGDALVRAPFAGAVVERGVAVGEYVNPGQTMATLVDIRTLRLELSVPETAVAAVKLGRKVTFEVGAYRGREFSGTVSRFSPNLRRASRDQIVEVEVTNADGALRPGMFAVGQLVVGEEYRPAVPETAVIGRPPSERVFVVRDRRVEERIVSTGVRRDGRVAVTNGLSAGELVVARPSERIRDGVRVK